MDLEITSRENPEYKELKSISKSSNGLIFIEGKKLFKEANKSNLTIEKIFIGSSNKALLKNYNCGNSKITFMNNELISSLFTTKHKPDNDDLIIALARKPEYSFTDVMQLKKNVLFLEDIQDPGNLGTIIRSSLAFDAGAVVLSENSVDCFNTKVIRGSAGAVFRMPVLFAEDSQEFLLSTKKHGYKVIAAVTGAVLGINDIDYKIPMVFLFGNEGRGLSDEILSFSDKNISIPVSNNLESLNLASSVNVILLELFRQRSNK